LDEALPEVREAGAEGFGMLVNMLGERSMQGYLAKLDNIKVKKVREFVSAVPVAAPQGKSIEYSK